MNLKKITATIDGKEKVEILSPVFGAEEIQTVRNFWPSKDVKISNPVPTDEVWDGKTLFLLRQNGRERRLV